MSDDNLVLDIRLQLDGFELSIDTTVELDGVTAVFGPSGSG